MVGNFEQCDHRGTSKLRDEDARVISMPYSPSICLLPLEVAFHHLLM